MSSLQDEVCSYLANHQKHSQWYCTGKGVKISAARSKTRALLGDTSIARSPNARPFIPRLSAAYISFGIDVKIPPHVKKTSHIPIQSFYASQGYAESKT